MAGAKRMAAMVQLVILPSRSDSKHEVLILVQDEVLDLAGYMVVVVQGLDQLLGYRAICVGEVIPKNNQVSLPLTRLPDQLV